MLATSSEAQTSDLVSDSAFRVCADPANYPMSMQDGSGFENALAELIASKLELPVSYTWFPQATGFVRNTLRAKACDVIMGYAQGHELVLNTNHYYTSVYTLIVPENSDLVGVQTLADPLLQGRRLGIVAGTPPAAHLARLGLIAAAKPYQLVVDRRVQSPAEDMLDDLSAKEIDGAVLWGPIGGPLVKADYPDFHVIPLTQETVAPKLFYRITMGVRQGEKVWQRQLNSLIRRHQDEINTLLDAAGVPLVNDMGTDVLKIEQVVAEPEGFRMDNYRAPVPETLNGAAVVDPFTALALWEMGEAVFIDVMPRPPKPDNLPEDTLWQEKPHDSIPRALWLPNVGYGDIAPETDAYFRAGLEQATEGRMDKPIVIFCQADCWMSWNAAKRAVDYGYSALHWMPLGTDGWTSVGRGLEPVEPLALQP